MQVAHFLNFIRFESFDREASLQTTPQLTTTATKDERFPAKIKGHSKARLPTIPSLLA